MSEPRDTSAPLTPTELLFAAHDRQPWRYASLYERYWTHLNSDLRLRKAVVGDDGQLGAGW